MHLERPLAATCMVTSSAPAPPRPSRYGGRERGRLLISFGSTTLPSGPFLRAACEAARAASPCDSRRLECNRSAGRRAPAVNARAVAPMLSGASARALYHPHAKSSRVPWGQHSAKRQQPRPGRLPSLRPTEVLRSRSRVERADRAAPVEGLGGGEAAPGFTRAFLRRGAAVERGDEDGSSWPSTTSSTATPLLKKARVKRALLLAAERQQREAAAAAQRERRDAAALVDAQREAMTPLPPSAACLLPSAWPHLPRSSTPLMPLQPLELASKFATSKRRAQSS